MSTVLRGARLPVHTKKEVVDFISSRESDRRIARSIVLVNEAHVVALLKARVITGAEARRLLGELRRLENSYPARGIGEDYHLYIEQELTRRLGGELGGKLHTAKSRNDQVATAIRMSLRESLLDLSTGLLSLVSKLLVQADRYKASFFVGYTHLQPAQPITFGHYLISIMDPLLRDNERILETYRRVNMSPMGSGALAGSSFPLDRQLVSRLLGFDGLIENSLDGVSGRDFLLEALGVCGLIASSLSHIAQDWIFYSSGDVGLVELPSEYSSTSSIMPQKKNPDPLEVVRARCAIVASNYPSAATILHALPTGYNLDFQEVTPLVWNSTDTLRTCISIMTGIVARIRPLNGAHDRHGIQFTVAAELANSLVRELDAPFRDAYRWVGQAVQLAIQNHSTLRDLGSADWRRIIGRDLSRKTVEVIQRVADPRSHIEIYRTEGSASKREVERMIRSRRRRVQQGLLALKRLRERVQDRTRQLRKVA